MRLDEILSLVLSHDHGCCVIVSKSNGQICECSGRAESLLEMIDSKMLTSIVVAIECRESMLYIEAEMNANWTRN